MAAAEGGRFDFDDGGSYVGEWFEGRAHGLGIATGPDNQGEYSGEWTMGFESRGVYVWPSGNIYAGGWVKGKRHGEGTQIKGRWIYRGAFNAGFCGRYGVKESLTTIARYEGSWHLNQFDGFGVETNSDGSSYSGGWSKGMRQGFGVRKSAAYSVASEYNRAIRAAQSQNSLPSTYDSDRGWKGSGNGESIERGRSETIRSGFVLRSCSSPLGSKSLRSLQSHSPGDKKLSFRKMLLRKLRKPKSTGDLSSVGAHTIGGQSSTGISSGGRFMLRSPRPGGSLRSNFSDVSQLNTNSGKFSGNSTLDHQSRIIPMINSPDEAPGPNTIETYSGQWNEDKRSGYGVAERSDGLRFEGEWFNNKKDGFGATIYPDGSREEGRYKENVLIQSITKRNKLYMLRHSKLRDNVEEAIRRALEAEKEANEKSSETAEQRSQTAREIAKTANLKADEARKLSELAREIANEFASDFVQMGIQWELENPYCQKVYKTNLLQNSSYNDQQGHTELTDGREESNKLPVNSLEVSGGNRRGSFRSSFKRNSSNPSSPDRNGRQLNKTQTTSNELNPDKQVEDEIRFKTQHTLTEELKPSTLKLTVDAPPPLKLKTETPSSLKLQADASSPSKPKTDTPTSSNLSPHATAAPPKIIQTATINVSEIVESPTFQRALLTSPTGATLLANSQVPIPEKKSEKSTQGRPIARATTGGFTALPDLLLSKEFLNPSVKKIRRKTLPSIMTNPPLRPVNSRETSMTRTLHLNGTSSPLGNRVGDKQFTVPGLSSTLNKVKSTEQLNKTDLETYIIEDCIRKRAQPINQTPLQSPGLQRSNARQRQTIPDKRSTRDRSQKLRDGIRSRGMGDFAYMQPDYECGDLLPLPHAYKIESIIDLTSGIDVSMPDVSKTSDGRSTMATIGHIGISGLLTKEEVSRLSQERRQEILLEAERKRRGEIIIRVADIKDWIRSNFIIVLVLLINICLAFLFINLINNAGNLEPSSSQIVLKTPEEKLAMANAAQEAVKKALRAANVASKPRNRP